MQTNGKAFGRSRAITQQQIGTQKDIHSRRSACILASQPVIYYKFSIVGHTFYGDREYCASAFSPFCHMSGNRAQSLISLFFE